MTATSLSFDHASPDEFCDGDAVREGGLLSNWSPFWGSQLRPPFPVGAPSRCISSSYMRSCSACAIAQSLASSCSALVRKPSCSCWLTSLPASELPLAHPSVILLRRDAASAITLRMSMSCLPGRVPPRRWPPALALVVALRFSAAVLACRRISSSGMRLPPSFWPCERKPSPV